jgi:hypothetical protein
LRKLVFYGDIQSSIASVLYICLVTIQSKQTEILKP